MSDPVSEVFAVVADTASEVREGLLGRREYEQGQNPSGDQQLAADTHADELFEERLLAVDGVGQYASEERPRVIENEAGADADYFVAVDPLDGSSNVKSNNAMGTIVGVYERPLPCSGAHLVAAGFVLYGPLTTMTVARDGVVTEYVVTDDGERYTARAGIRLPDDPTVFGFGGRYNVWPDAFRAYADEVRHELKLRYGGAMIADVNQVLTYGGVFAYPALTTHPEGKLRLLFEGNPIGYIVEAAGGRSSDGERSLLDVPCEDLHQRVPLHIGNREYVERLEAALAD